MAFLWVGGLGRGVVGIARADDWAYLITQFHLAETGEIHLNNWAVTMLIGQTLLAWPIAELFPGQIAPLQAAVALSGVAALALTYLAIRRPAGRGVAAVAVGVLAVSPIFGPSAISFMTDVPALMFMSAGILAGYRGLRSRSVNIPWLVLSGILGVVAFTFRDYAIAGFAVMWVIAVIRVRTSPPLRRRVVAVGLVIVVVAASLYVWRHSLPYDLKLPGWSVEYSVTLIARGLLTLALLVSPVLVLASPRRLWSVIRRRGWVSVGFAVALTAGVVVTARYELLGNVIHPFGTTWLVAGSGARMWPLGVNRALFILASLALAYLTLIVVATVTYLWPRVRSRHLGPFITSLADHHAPRSVIALIPLVILAIHVFATGLLGAWFIDRYFILVLPFLAATLIMVFRQTRTIVHRGVRWIAAAAFVVYAVWGVYVVDFTAATEGSRWGLAKDVAELGYAAESIDGGMQWFSFHEPVVGLPGQAVSTRAGRPWWTERYPNRPVCVTISLLQPGDALPANALLAREDRTWSGSPLRHVALPGPDACPLDP